MRKIAAGAAIGGAAAALTLILVRRRVGQLRFARGLAAVRLAARGGARYASRAPALFASAGQNREQLRNDLALRTAEDVAVTLGAMKGVLMKIGQMASYVDDGLSPAERRPRRRRGGGGTGPAAGAGVRPLGPAAHRRRLDRPGAPRDHS
jgi:hypothetical protein